MFNRIDIYHQCRGILLNLTVEPIAAFIFLSLQLWVTTFQAGLRQVICYQLYHGSNSINCANPITDKAVDNHIQQRLANWTAILFLVLIIPGMISSCILGAWADIAGRKTNIVLSISGIIIAIFPQTIFFTYKSTPLWILAVIHFIGGSFGFIPLIFTSAMAYLTDTTIEKDALTFRMVMFSVLMSLSGVVGSSVGGALLKVVHLSVVIVIVEALLAISLFYTILRLEQLPPSVMRQKVLAKNISQNSISKENPIVKNSEVLPKNNIEDISSKKDGPGCMTITFIIIPKLICRLLRDIYRTYAMQRPGKQRIFLILTAVIVFMNIMMDTLKGNIMGQYTLKHPFNWNVDNGAKLSYWRAVSGLLNFIGNSIGIIIFKKVLIFNDTSIILIAILSLIGELVIIGISTNEWMLYLAAAVGCLSNLLLPMVASFITQIVRSDEIGKSFVAQGLASSLAFMAGTIVFEEIYKSTLEFYAGFVFLFGACMMALCFFIILWIHLCLIREHKMADSSDTEPRDIGMVVIQRAGSIPG